jgi:hypothetical protein
MADLLIRISDCVEPTAWVPSLLVGTGNRGLSAVAAGRVGNVIRPWRCRLLDCGSRKRTASVNPDKASELMIILSFSDAFSFDSLTRISICCFSRLRTLKLQIENVGNYQN